MKFSFSCPDRALSKRKSISTILVATLACTLVLHAENASENLLLQGGFEDWVPAELPPSAPAPNLPDGLPFGCTLHFYPNKAVSGVVEDAEGYTLARDTEIKHSGEAALRIEGTMNTCDVGIFFKPTVIEPGNRYKITVWLRGEDIALSPRLAKFAGAGIRWQAGTQTTYWGNEGQLHGNVELPENLRCGTFDWTKVTFEVDAKDSTALGFRVILQAATGKLWVDHASIESLSN